VIHWIFQSDNTIFAIAFCVVLLFALVELAGLLFGASLSDALEVEDGGVFGWLNSGSLPFLIQLCVLLSLFSVSGYTTQALAYHYIGRALPQSAAVAIAFVSALFVGRVASKLLGKFWPKDESSAVTRDALVGRVGTVTLGTATPERAAEVRVTGPNGDMHYVLTFAVQEPLPQGCQVLLISQHATLAGQYVGIADTTH
jgi:hypothetical protein